MLPSSPISPLRIRNLVDRNPNPDGEWVLYWMTAYRRPTDNYALDRAIEWARHLRKPLIVLEAVRIGYRWACDRFHQFLVDGMIDNKDYFQETSAHYYPYIERKKGDGHGMVEHLAKRSCVVISDDFPCFFYRALYERIACRFSSRFELVDSNGILPLRAADRTFTVAHSYRRFMQKEVSKYWKEAPKRSPFQRLELPKIEEGLSSFVKKWPPAKLDRYQPTASGLSDLAIDHQVRFTGRRGGFRAANDRWRHFLQTKLSSYGVDRNEPDLEGASGLSPYLHFGHISSHAIFRSLLDAQDWDASKVGSVNGSMHGFWNIGKTQKPLSIS